MVEFHICGSHREYGICEVYSLAISVAIDYVCDVVMWIVRPRHLDSLGTRSQNSPHNNPRNTRHSSITTFKTPATPSHHPIPLY